jgi:hypothetical protein
LHHRWSFPGCRKCSCHGTLPPGFLLEPHPFAAFAGEFNIGHELHFNPDDPFSLALFTPPAVDVEREMRCLEIVLYRCLLFRKKLAYLIVCFKIGNRIGAARLSYRILIDKLNSC